MAQYCKRCYIELFAPSPEEMATIELSDPEDLEVCESCMSFGRYVVSVGGIPNEYDEEDYEDDYYEEWE